MIYSNQAEHSFLEDYKTEYECVIIQKYTKMINRKCMIKSTNQNKINIRIHILYSNSYYFFEKFSISRIQFAFNFLYILFVYNIYLPYKMTDQGNTVLDNLESNYFKTKVGDKFKFIQYKKFIEHYAQYTGYRFGGTKDIENKANDKSVTNIKEDTQANKRQFTNLSHRVLYGLLKKALFGLYQDINNNLNLTIENFYDLSKIAKSKCVQQTPCDKDRSDAFFNDTLNTTTCNCLIGVLIKQQIFVNSGKIQDTEVNHQTNSNIENFIQGRVAVGMNLENEDTSKKNPSLEMQTGHAKQKSKLYNIKTYKYIYGRIILKNNFFKNDYMAERIISFRNKMIENKGNQKYFKNQKQNQKTQVNSDQLEIIQQFKDDFGEYIATKCDVGLYVTQYVEKKTQKKENQDDLLLGFSAIANVAKENQETNKTQQNSNNLLIVIEPTIIKRYNYVRTDYLAEVQTQTEQTLMKYYLQSKLYLLYFKKGGQKIQLVNMNTDVNSIQQLSNKNVNLTAGEQYRKQIYDQNSKLNRFKTIGFYNVKIDCNSKYRYKYLVTCKLINRSLKRKCRLYIKMCKTNNIGECYYFELDQISIHDKKNNYKYLNGYSYENVECNVFTQTKEEQNRISLLDTEQNNGFFFLQAFETKNDERMKLAYIRRRQKQLQKQKQMNSNKIENKNP